MITYDEISDVREELVSYRRQGRTIGFVPTMGALHQGHLSLVNLAKSHADVVVMSVFVNPMQFNEPQDLKAYPKDIARDMKKADDAGVDVLFIPTEEDLFPSGAICGDERSISCRVHSGSYGWALEGASRPGHFEGVVTVVSALFNIVQPDLAFFGQKDYQQAKVIEQLIHDLHFPVQLILGQTVREQDGLAMSSRNVNLSPLERKRAAVFPESLFRAQQMAAEGEQNAIRIKETVLGLFSEVSGLSVDYVEIVDTETLSPLKYLEGEAQLLAAISLDGIHLIDNVRLELGQS